MASISGTRLKRLEDWKARFGEGASARKLELVRALGATRLSSAREVERFHEALCFLRAYPDDAELLERVERELSRFERRPDLSRHREALADTGIAGTTIRFAFYAPTASWLVRRHPDRLSIDWDAFEDTEALECLLELLVLWSETPALDEDVRTVERWIAILKAPRETDAAFLVRRFSALPAAPAVRQRVFEGIDVPFVLAPGPGTPSRTRARHAGSPVAYQTSPLASGRPDLAREIRRPPRAIRAVTASEGARLVDLAREAMVTRSRDLDAFMFADPGDVRLVDCGGGLQFACIGVRPERRLLLEGVYGFLTLRNGVPIGYVLASALMRSCEVAFNVFETFRGGESSLVYVRALSMCRALFGADTFTIYPYQLGHENEEGLRSGAWWFYAKLGFRPRDASALAVLRREERALRADPGHRSSLATLRKLAAHNLYWSTGEPRQDVIGSFPLARIGAATTAFLAGRFGADRERGQRTCAEEAGKILGLRGWRSLPPPERLAFERWAPLVRILPGIESWSAAARRSLVSVLRAKGGRRESDFVRLFDAHIPLRRALCRIAGVRTKRDGGRKSSGRRPDSDRRET